MNHRTGLSILFGFMMTATVYAQESVTVGELLSKGAKKLTREEVVNIYAAGPTISGVAPSGNRKFELTYSKDGKLSGHSTDMYGQRGSGLFGTWVVNDAGQFCTQIRNSFGRDSTPNPPCGFRYKLGDAIYSAGSEDPQTAARLLSFSK